MTRTLFATTAALLLAACGGEVSDGGVGSDTQVEEIEDRNAVEALPEAEEAGGADSRRGDYPETGERMTVNPIEPGNEEPGGKDVLSAEEREAAEVDDPER